MQTKLQNWVIDNLVTGGYSLSYDVLNVPELDRLIELAQEAKVELQNKPDEVISAVWTDVDWDLDEEGE